MKFIAHRGYRKEGMENSIEAFLNAINEDYFSGFELDIRESKDHKFVVIHDPIINRVTNKSGFVKSKKYSFLKKLNIPLLEDVLKLKTNKIILIEIKDYNLNLNKLVKLLNKYQKQNIYVTSFSIKVIKNLSEYPRKFKIGALNMVINSEKNYDYYDFIGLYKNILTNDLLKYFIKKNIEVFIWGLLDNIKLDSNLLYQNQLYLIVNKKIP